MVTRSQLSAPLTAGSATVACFVDAAASPLPLAVPFSSRWFGMRVSLVVSEQESFGLSQLNKDQTDVQ